MAQLTGSDSSTSSTHVWPHKIKGNGTIHSRNGNRQDLRFLQCLRAGSKATCRVTQKSAEVISLWLQQSRRRLAQAAITNQQTLKWRFPLLVAALGRATGNIPESSTAIGISCSVLRKRPNAVLHTDIHTLVHCMKNYSKQFSKHLSYSSQNWLLTVVLVPYNLQSSQQVYGKTEGPYAERQDSVGISNHLGHRTRPHFHLRTLLMGLSICRRRARPS